MPSPAARTHRHVVPVGHPGILPAQPTPAKIHPWERQRGCRGARRWLPHGHPIRGPASGAESPEGTPFWRGARRVGVTPQGPGAHPIPHILPCWGALTASPGRDGIPLEGRDACPGQCPDSPATDRAISITAITGRSRACPGMPREAGGAPEG